MLLTLLGAVLLYLYPPRQGGLVWGAVLATRLTSGRGRAGSRSSAFSHEVTKFILILNSSAVRAYPGLCAPYCPSLVAAAVLFHRGEHDAEYFFASYSLVIRVVFVRQLCSDAKSGGLENVNCGEGVLYSCFLDVAYPYRDYLGTVGVENCFVLFFLFFLSIRVHKLCLFFFVWFCVHRYKMGVEFVLLLKKKCGGGGWCLL